MSLNTDSLENNVPAVCALDAMNPLQLHLHIIMWKIMNKSILWN